MRHAGLPEPQTNVLVHGELADVYWPQARLVVELDGARYHRTRARFEDDRRRDAKLGVAAIVTIRLTKRRLRDETRGVIAQLRALIARRAA